MIGYRRALKGPASRRVIESDKPDCVRVVMRRATSRTWKHLARERLENVKPNIPRHKVAAGKTGRQCDRRLFEREEVRNWLRR
jgi:hypothetical protein